MDESGRFVARHVASLPKSGIRDFFAIVSKMKDAVSLGIGEPDFVTPFHIREAAMIGNVRATGSVRVRLRTDGRRPIRFNALPQGTVPFRVCPNGPLMLRIELLPAGALRVQGPRTRVSRVLPNEPGVSWLKEMALLAITPSSLLRLRLDNRVEADPGGGGRSRARTRGGEPITATSPSVPTIARIATW